MTNDPNDRFMISDLSSKLSAYINGEDVNFVTYDDEPVYTQTDTETYNRKSRNIEDALAAEIKPVKQVRKTPGDTMFSDLDHALDDAYREQNNRKQLSGVQYRQEQARQDQYRQEQARQSQYSQEQARQAQYRQEQLRQEQYRQEQARQEQYRQEQARQEQYRQEQARQEQYRQEQARQEQYRQEQVRQEQYRQEQLRQEQIRKSQQKKVVDFSYGLYDFNLDQPFTSVHSNHTTRYSPKPSAPRPAVNIPEQSEVRPPEETAAQASYAGAFTDPGNTAEQSRSYDLPESEHSLDEHVHSYGSYDSYDDDHKRKGGSRLGVFIALLLAIVVGATLFILIRKYSSNLAGLVTGNNAAESAAVSTTEPAAGADETQDAQEAQAGEAGDAQDQEDAQEAQTEEAGDAAVQSDAQETAGVAEADAGTDTEVVESTGTEEGIGTNDGGTESVVSAGEDDEALAGDPSDISYIAAVNEKASADAIAELDAKNPRLYLSSYGLKISAGTSFNALAYVENIEDDADDRSRLYKDISVNGLDTFDANTPGTYELVYFCYDSAGNRSNRAKMTVIVE